MLVSLNSYKFNTPQVSRLRNDAPSPAPAPQEPAQGDKASIYFTGNDNDAGSSMRKAATYMAAAILALTASCSDGDDDVIAHAQAVAEATISGIPKTDTTATDTTWGKRDTVYKHDTVTIEKWKYYFNRPIPLDTLMKDLDKFDVDSTSYPNDSTDNRNIVHYEAVREWEYNNKEVGDIYLPESSGKILVYNTDIKDYLDNHLYYGKRILRIPTTPFTIETYDGRTLHSPKGYFVEVYRNPTSNKKASVYDCSLQSREFCQTIGDSVRVFKYQDGKYIEDGRAAKGYLGANTILLRDLIGEYETDDHLTNVKVSSVDDETLIKIYLKQMDEADDKTVRTYIANSSK